MLVTAEKQSQQKMIPLCTYASSAMLCSQLNLLKDTGKVEQNGHSTDFTWEAGVAAVFPTQVQRPIA